MNYSIYNAYPIYDWKTQDIWIANGKFGWTYNHLYDLYYQAGVPLSRQRVASPFISQAISTLFIYKVVDPDMWGRMVGRVNGVGFAGIYGNTSAMGWRAIKCPAGFSWEKYMYFLLNTLPEETRENYLNKLRVSRKFWREKEDASVRRLSLSYGRLIFLSLWKNVPLTIRIRNRYGWSISMISIYLSLKKSLLTNVCVFVF